MNDRLIIDAPALTELPTEALWLRSLSRWATLGVLERPGPHQDHPLIVEMLLRVGQRAPHDETAWCSAAMNAAMDEAGIGGTGSARARSWEEWGQHLSRPRFGCVAVLWREQERGPYGHVACWLGEVAGGAQMVLLGGNQGDRVGVALYPRHRLLSYRWPDASVIGDPALRPTQRESVRAKGGKPT
jgi:uncharacterized protein (TIGR02594 family)